MLGNPPMYKAGKVSGKVKDDYRYHYISQPCLVHLLQGYKKAGKVSSLTLQIKQN